MMIAVLSMGILVSCGNSTKSSGISVDNSDVQAEADQEPTENGEEEISYRMITMDEAKSLFEAEGDYIILDVRTAEEYAEGHIPGAINIPNEDIASEQLEDLPDLNQVIYVYCRSGNRSKQAAEKMVDIGYTNVIEFGGIIDWTGEIETEVVDMEQADTAESESMEDNSIYVTVNGTVLTAKLEENSSSEALIQKLSEGDITVEMSDYANFEKVGSLGFELPTNDRQYTTKAGDIILYQGSNIVFYYDTNSWNFTKLGEFQNVSQEDLMNLFGSDGITAVLSLSK